MSAPVAPTRLKAYKSNSRSKWVTREIAALEFLLEIPLEAEQEIVRKGWMQQQGIVDDQSKRTEDEEGEKVEVLEPPTQDLMTRSSHLSSHQSHHGRWWEKWVVNNPRQTNEIISKRSRVEYDDLDQPQEGEATVKGDTSQHNRVLVPVVHAPGRRLQGDSATKIQIPLPQEAVTVITRQRNVTKMAIMREWEIKVAHGIGDVSNKIPVRKSAGPAEKPVRPPMLDGRIFLSAGESYPIGVFSLLRYEPKKEEAARRRQKLEARGGGGTQFFIMPVRDWRGISYRALLPPRSSQRRSKHQNVMSLFDRFTSSSSENLDLRSKQIEFDRSLAEDDSSSESSDDEDEDYVVGLLDDPEMVQGRHRNVMIGDRVTGPIASSTIQFVKPALLKADLNKQFRDRFDGWEPPKGQRKYIGARVVDGVYTLMDPSQVGEDATVDSLGGDSQQHTVTTVTSGMSASISRKRQNSVSSISTGGGGVDTKETIRMPPSLTLSKIRSIKRQALLAAVQAKLEISTVALSIVYFERLCLDCRVDKTNRRLSYAACLLLALKMNEAHVELVMTKQDGGDSKGTNTNRLQSLIRPSRKSGNVVASLLEFFTQEWNLSLKHIYAAEWGVFAALQFKLHAKPSQVAFHFRRLLKAMDWSPRSYLGPEMYTYWMDALSQEEYLRLQREERHKQRQERKERKKIIHLQRELEAANLVGAGSNSRIELRQDRVDDDEAPEATNKTVGMARGENEAFSPAVSPKKKRESSRGGLGRILTHFAGGKKALSSDKLALTDKAPDGSNDSLSKLPMSPSMPTFPTEVDFASDVSKLKIPYGDDDEVRGGNSKKVKSPSSEMLSDEELEGIVV